MQSEQWSRGDFDQGDDWSFLLPSAMFENLTHLSRDKIRKSGNGSCQWRRGERSPHIRAPKMFFTRSLMDPKFGIFCDLPPPEMACQQRWAPVTGPVRSKPDRTGVEKLVAQTGPDRTGVRKW